MRPRTLDEVVGQQHVLGPGSPLRRLVEGGGTTSVLLWGPPGSGKTTLARLLAAGRRFVELSAVTAGGQGGPGGGGEGEGRPWPGGGRAPPFVGEGGPVHKAPPGARLPRGGAG